MRVHRDKTECANSGLKVGTVYNCNSCGNYEYQTLFSHKEGKDRPKPAKLEVSGSTCTLCSQPYYLNTPIWLSPLNSQPFVQRMFDSLEKNEETGK